MDVFNLMVHLDKRAKNKKLLCDILSFSFFKSFKSHICFSGEAELRTECVGWMKVTREGGLVSFIVLGNSCAHTSPGEHECKYKLTV